VVTEYFEALDDVWVELDASDGDDCWVPRRFLEAAALHAADPVPAKGAPLPAWREFDLPLSESDSDPVRDLEKAGLLRVIDPADEVIGVLLTIDPDDRDQVRTLARSYRFGEDLLDEEIRSLAHGVARRYEKDPVLGPLLRFALEEERRTAGKEVSLPGETD
jgi:hypothetical protein